MVHVHVPESDTNTIKYKLVGYSETNMAFRLLDPILRMSTFLVSTFLEMLVLTKVLFMCRWLLLDLVALPILCQALISEVPRVGVQHPLDVPPSPILLTVRLQIVQPSKQTALLKMLKDLALMGT